MEMLEKVSAKVLRNVGAPIYLQEVAEDGTLLHSEEKEPALKQVYLRFDANAVAAIEDMFGGNTTEVPMKVNGPPDAEGNPTEITVLREGQPIMVKVPVPVGTAFDEGLRQRTMKTLRDVIALGLEEDPRVIGRRMLPRLQDDYLRAVEVAWSISQGIDPDTAKKVWDAATKINEAKQALQNAAADEVANERNVKTDAPTGQASTENGADLAAPPTSSGG